jgi:hypothetical protein
MGRKEQEKNKRRRGLNAEGAEVGAQRTLRSKPKSTARNGCATLMGDYMGWKSALRGCEGVC